MAVPFRRTSKTAKRKRRTHYKLEKPAIVLSKETGKYVLQHHASKAGGGYYDGKVVNPPKPVKDNK
jgi:large subunit ribosomal protein L32